MRAARALTFAMIALACRAPAFAALDSGGPPGLGEVEQTGGQPYMTMLLAERAPGVADRARVWRAGIFGAR